MPGVPRHQIREELVRYVESRGEIEKDLLDYAIKANSEADEIRDSRIEGELIALFQEKITITEL